MTQENIRQPQGQPAALKESNQDRQRDKQARIARRAHEWRVRVWAESELRIRSANATLRELGGEEFVPWQPNFEDTDQLNHYATMPVSR